MHPWVSKSELAGTGVALGPPWGYQQPGEVQQPLSITRTAWADLGQGAQTQREERSPPGRRWRDATSSAEPSSAAPPGRGWP